MEAGITTRLVVKPSWVDSSAEADTDIEPEWFGLGLDLGEPLLE